MRSFSGTGRADHVWLIYVPPVKLWALFISFEQSWTMIWVPSSWFCLKSGMRTWIIERNMIESISINDLLLLKVSEPFCLGRRQTIWLFPSLNVGVIIPFSSQLTFAIGLMWSYGGSRISQKGKDANPQDPK